MTTTSDDLTELTELRAEKVSGVTTPANGTGFLLLKAAETEDCDTCGGSGKILQGNRKCPDCKGSGQVAKSNSSEADAQEEEMTGEAAKAWEGVYCGDQSCAVCVISDSDGTRLHPAVKALSESDRKKMPSSAFAFVDKNGGKHLPVHDAAHAKAALGRFNQQDFSEAKGDPADAKKKAAGKIKAAAKKHGIEVADDSNVAQAAKGAIQEALNGTDEPKAAGSLDGSKSGVAGSVTAGVAERPESTTSVLGGSSSYEIPLEDHVRTNPPTPPSTDGAGIARAAVVALAKATEEIGGLVHDRLIKDAKIMTLTPPQGDAAMTPGSPPWESYDAATLQQVGESLASCCQALDCIAQRERTEGNVANPGDLQHAWDLEEAEQALDYALGVVARLSFHEAAEGQATKAGRVLSGKNTQALTAARDHLQAVIDGAQGKPATADNSEKESDDIMATLTKEELVEANTASFMAAVKQLREEEKAEKAEKKKAKAEKEAAEKDQVNPETQGGEIAEADIKATGKLDANNPGGIAGAGSVTVQKETEELAELVKSLDARQKEHGELLSKATETLQKIANRPRPGGPLLGGQAPQGAGTEGQATKEQGDELTRLEKALSEATTPEQREAAGQALTLHRLSALNHRLGWGERPAVGASFGA